MVLYTSTLLALGARIPVLLYKDRYVAVNKPPGISTHRSFDTGRRRVLTTQLQRQFRRKVYTVHRLDHRTSGCILFGFDGEAAGECHGRLRDGVKEYVALLRGFDERDAVGSEVVVEKPIKGDNGELRPAKTTFRKIAGQEEPRCTLVISDAAYGPPAPNTTPRASALDADHRRQRPRRFEGEPVVAAGARPRPPRARPPASGCRSRCPTRPRRSSRRSRGRSCADVLRVGRSGRRAQHASRVWTWRRWIFVDGRGRRLMVMCCVVIFGEPPPPLAPPSTPSTRSPTRVTRRRANVWLVSYKTLGRIFIDP